MMMGLCCWAPAPCAVDAIFAAVRSGRRGETYIPRVPSARVVDIASTLMNGNQIPIVYTGIRPGEKIHEILVSEEECYRTSERDGYYVIHSILPELSPEPHAKQVLDGAFSSADAVLDRDKVKKILSVLIAARDEEIEA